MKKLAWWGLIPVIVIAFIVAIGVSMRGNQVYAQANSESKAAVLLLCRANFFQNPPGGYTVIIADSSPNAPAIQRGIPCATALETLFKEGFAIREVSGNQFGSDSALYTLVRPIGLANHGN